MSQYIEDALPIVKYNGLNTVKNVDFSGATSVALPAGTTIAGTTAAGATTVTSTSATAFTVGANGATNPVFNVNANTASVATGLTIVGAAAAGGVALTVTSSATDDNLVINAKGTGTVSINATATGAITLARATTISGNTGITGTATVTSASAAALSVGLNGATNPSFVVDSSTGSQAAGLSVTGATAAGTVAVAVISSGGAANLTVNAKGTGTIGIGSVSTGAVTITPATTVTGKLSLGAALGSTTQAITGSGAVDVITLITKMNTTGGGTYTLADGTDGQVKIAVLDVDGGDAVITPTTKTGFTTLTFDAVGDGCTLVFVTGRGWMVVGNNGVALG